MRNYGVDYPGFVNPPDSAYPYSSPKNATTDTSEDGTPVEEKWVGDVWGFFQSAVSQAGVTPNGQTESVANPQILSAIQKSTLAKAVVENMLKGDQNFNIPGDQGVLLPSSTPKNYASGVRFTKTRFSSGSGLVNATYSGGVFDASSGSYYQDYNGNHSSNYFCLVLPDGSNSKQGVTIGFINGKTRITVDMSIAPAHKFIGLSKREGEFYSISPEKSSSEMGSIVDMSLSADSWYIVYENGYVEQGGRRIVNTTGTTTTYPLAVSLFVSASAIHLGGDNTVNCSIFDPTTSQIKIAGGVGAPVEALWEMRGKL